MKLIFVVLLMVAIAGCNGADSSNTMIPNINKGLPHAKLSDYGFFKGNLNKLDPNDGVYPFSVRSILWSDGAHKARFIAIPRGSQVTFSAGETWTWPAGTIVIKNFYFPADMRQPDGPRRIIETRLLHRVNDNWKSYVYLWNMAQTEATMFVAGTRAQVEYIDRDGKAFKGDYIVPNVNQCTNCHGRGGKMHLLGPVTPQLNMDVLRENKTINQLKWLADKGILKGLPSDISGIDRFENPVGTGNLEKRARAYLHANCSHCHRPGGLAGSTGLHLSYTVTDKTKLGFCKGPIAAGSATGNFSYDIDVGRPESSIMIYRMKSTDPGTRMPELPNLLPDPDGISVISEWISSLTEPNCSTK